MLPAETVHDSVQKYINNQKNQLALPGDHHLTNSFTYRASRIRCGIVLLKTAVEENTYSHVDIPASASANRN